MEKRYTVDEMLALMRAEKIHTWFDLGLFIDRIKEENPIPVVSFSGSYEEFIREISSGAMAFVTFHYSVDGVTVEIEKYAKLFRKNFPGITIHYIGGEFFPESGKLISPDTKKYELEKLKAFDKWDLYKEFYFVKLERGSTEYNDLIIKFWKQVVTIVEKVGKYIEENNISLIYMVNVCSNPGNVAYSLAIVLLSEFLGIPVINNNHDFYWEGGNRPMDIGRNGIKKGPRDFFFTNSDVGEFFSIIEMIFPWESRSWLNVNINKGQIEHVIKVNGHNPANVMDLGTAVDTEEYLNISKRKKINAYIQFEDILSRYEKTLVSYSVSDVLGSVLVDKIDPKPILIGLKTKAQKKFSSENIIFLQPTRIIARKRIETGFILVRRLFQDITFLDKLKKHPNLKITILITGPIATGHYEYFNKLVKGFSSFLDEIKPAFREKVFLACLFSEMDKEEFKKRHENPVGIPELYNIASLILLPSKTEGRGLPIIEAAACGTPIICRRYDPRDVYREVIGEHLGEEDRLKVIEFDGRNIKKRHVKEIVDRIFFPNKYVDEVLHNRNVVLKRYSLLSLNKNLKKICYHLYLQLRPNENSLEVAKRSLNRYRKIVEFRNEDLNQLLNMENRHYMPGYGRLAFMIFLKSLIDPSYFRVEQQAIRGMVLNFAQNILLNNPEHGKFEHEKIVDFYNAIDNIFRYREGEFNIRHDHSMSYRHRNKYYYPYQDFTLQELTGVVNLLYNEILKPKNRQSVDETPHFFTDWNLALSQLTTSSVLAIDDREKLMQKMHENIPIAYFPGDFVKYELEFFALQSVRARLKLTIEEELTEEVLDNAEIQIAPIYIFAQGKSIVRQLNKHEIIEYIERGKNYELKLLFRKNILRIVTTNQLCVGIHFPQLGEKALNVLNQIRKNGGYIISNRRSAAVMTDIVNIDRFHIGKVRSKLTENILGIPADSGYIQYVPAGVRTTLAYPTPIQTAKEFSEVLKSDFYKGLINRLGEDKVLEEIRKDAEQKGSPIKYVLEKLNKGDKEEHKVNFSYVSGVYQDGHPWNGVIASIENSRKELNWKFVAVSSKTLPKRVTTFAEEFYEQTGKKALIAWNGGYILNPELVGKLGLPESYIGSPLGMIISGGKVLSAPLFNKAVLAITDEAEIKISRVNCSRGIEIEYDNEKIIFSEKDYNCEDPENERSYYDLMYDHEHLNGGARVFVRLAGNVIKDIIHSGKDELVPVIPVGLTLAFKKDLFPKGLEKIDKVLNIKIKGLENIEHAIEAGPLLLKDGEVNKDMHTEGWKTHNSIQTQAARLDYTDMRGPKIAAGIDKKGNLSVLTINGRIRESVGATHEDMANILLKFGIQYAMGFDPGGSSTLVVEGHTKNISPYNREYENNVYSLPPEPRAVSNAVIGFMDSQ